jgi:hypothetical protein
MPFAMWRLGRRTMYFGIQDRLAAFEDWPMHCYDVVGQMRNDFA